jgi:hypothetical protein
MPTTNVGPYAPPGPPTRQPGNEVAHREGSLVYS